MKNVDTNRILYKCIEYSQSQKECINKISLLFMKSTQNNMLIESQVIQVVQLSKVTEVEVVELSIWSVVSVQVLIEPSALSVVLDEVQIADLLVLNGE